MPLDFWNASNLLTLPNIAHGFSRRAGGTSSPPFDALNLGLHVGDDAGAVRENRARVTRAFGLDLSRMVCAEQVHGGAVAVVRESDAGRGATNYADALPGVDALVTNAPGLLLSLFFADCVPVFFADEHRGAVGVAHAGWRGVVADVLENTIQVMHREFGTAPGTLQAAIGAGIGTEAFVVGAEVAARFGHHAVLDASGAWHIDLPGAVRSRLENAGIPPAQIVQADECTASSPALYFSHRASGGRTGRMGAFISLL